MSTDAPYLPLSILPPGMIFTTRDGTLAVKSEYLYDDSPDPLCILLESGEYAHFPNGENELVRALELPNPNPIEYTISKDLDALLLVMATFAGMSGGAPLQLDRLQVRELVLYINALEGQRGNH